jgi:hypothetical protein
VIIASVVALAVGAMVGGSDDTGTTAAPEATIEDVLGGDT